MAYNEKIASRVVELLYKKNIPFVEKKMFGGVAFLINDKMCAGVIKDDLMLRVMDERYEGILEMNYARQMDFTGKPLKGYVLVELDGIKTNQDLEKWIDYSLEFGRLGVVKSKKKKY